MAAPMLMFDWVEYLVFGVMLGASALIGVFFGFIKGGQNTVEGYLLGGKTMGVFSISMSLVSSFTSGTTLLGIPAEIYIYGTPYVSASFAFITCALICVYLFLPVFCNLQTVSVYEYMELRFDKNVRKLASFLFTTSLFAYIPVVIYGPSLALNQVTGFGIHTIALILCVVCIFYTSFGGLKAVVWADTLQGAAMFLASVLIAVIGTIRVGGISAIFQAMKDGDRLEFFNMDPDPTLRTSFWIVVIGQTVGFTASSTINPSAIQRYIALNSLSKARRAAVLYSIGCWALFFLSCYTGFVVYKKFEGCDPMASGYVQRPDQIVPFFILDVMGNIPGLPGLFLAGVVCAALSTMSTAMNTLSGTIYEDFIEPMVGKTTEFRASLIMKVLVVVFGVISLFLVMVIEKLGNLVELSNALGGLTAGSILGIFVLGLFFPPANSIGALSGGLGSLGVMSWIVVGARSAIARGDLVYPTKSIRVDQCPFNTTYTNMTMPNTPVSGKVFFLFELSFFYYALFGCTVTVVIGLLVSYLTGKNLVVDRKLLSPAVRRLYQPVPVKETEMNGIKA